MHRFVAILSLLFLRVDRNLVDEDEKNNKKVHITYNIFRLITQYIDINSIQDESYSHSYSGLPGSRFYRLPILIFKKEAKKKNSSVKTTLGFVMLSQLLNVGTSGSLCLPTENNIKIFLLCGLPKQVTVQNGL